MSESVENSEPADKAISAERDALSNVQHAVGGVGRPRPGAMEPLKILCNSGDDGELVNGLENGSDKYHTPPASPKHKEPRAKMSLSPNKTGSKGNGNGNAAGSDPKPGIRRGFARKTMTPDRVLTLKGEKQRPSSSNDSKSTSPASSREGSVESLRSNVDSQASEGKNSSKEASSGPGARLRSDSQCSEKSEKSGKLTDPEDGRSETSSARSSPIKFLPRARKSIPGKQTVTEEKGKTGMTLKLGEIEHKLGLHGQSLAKMDAKTLDLLILKNASLKPKPKEGSRENSPAKLTMQTKLPPVDTPPRSESPTIKVQPTTLPENKPIETDSDSTSFQPNAEKSDILDSPSKGKKKRKKRSGTYSLPSHKKPWKKKKPLDLGSPKTSAVSEMNGDSSSVNQAADESSVSGIESQDTSEMEVSCSDDAASGKQWIFLFCLQLCRYPGSCLMMP